MARLREHRAREGTLELDLAAHAARRRVVSAGQTAFLKQLKAKGIKNMRKTSLLVGSPCRFCPPVKKPTRLVSGTILGWQNRRLVRGRRWIWITTAKSKEKAAKKQSKVLCLDGDFVFDIGRPRP